MLRRGTIRRLALVEEPNVTLFPAPVHVISLG